MRVASVFIVLVLGCAVDEAPDRVAAPIIGGADTPQEVYPATGALLVSLIPSCTGTLVSPSVVLTAAHCVDPELTGGQVPGFTLQANGLAAPLHTIVEGAEARIHPDFDLNREPNQSGVTQWFDVALLILAEPIEDVEYGVIAVPAEAERALVAGSSVEIVGYGQNELDDMFAFGVKKNALTTIQDVGDFEIWTSPVGDPQKCFGDSGGPAYVEMAGGLRIAGLASRLPGPNAECVDGAIETRVDSYVEWIADNAPEMCDELECDDTGLPVLPEADGGCRTAFGSASPTWAPLLGVLLLLRRRRKHRNHRS